MEMKQESEIIPPNRNGGSNILSIIDSFDLGICTDDTSTLIKQLQATPTIYYEFSKKLEDIRGYLSQLKLELKVKEAMIAREARRMDFKIAETKINRIIYEDEDYLRLQASFNQANVVEGKLTAFVKGLEQRQNIMLSVLHFMRQELRQHTI